MIQRKQFRKRNAKWKIVEDGGLSADDIGDLLELIQELQKSYPKIEVPKTKAEIITLLRAA